MSGAKLIVIYPMPTDVAAFEEVYRDEHVPMAMEKLKGATKIVASRVVGAPDGNPAFHRIAEVHFPSMVALGECAASEGGQQTIDHARRISSGGAPLFLVAEEATVVL
ncbi:ethyl tert-butyl ether degradation protein EthD [Azoarcus sp. DD4]|uniref:EthD family reductase n=1 Tax=Azoarcus sp. DD4 TaxID=2027405 RepID=UPI001128D1B2|nr:EthD family reductase [Azoarcus sp. DD4]QDF97011.1 ethyl tert-butyl ether degradation protein EthD [Azoarcus sp. DD4]